MNLALQLVCTLILTLSSTMIAGLGVSPEQDQKSTPFFHLSGEVHDAGSAASEVVFTSGGTTKSAPLDSSGKYSIELPLGSWTLSVPKAHYREGYQRSFKVTQPSELVLNVKMSSHTQIFDMKADDGTKYTLVFTYHDYWWNPLRHYDYKGLAVHAEYNFNTITAPHIFFKKKEATMLADGGVVVTNPDGREKQYQSALLQLKDGTVRILKAE